MEEQELLLQPKIVSRIMEMQVEHSLPLEIELQENINGMKKVVLRYKAEDELMVDWVTEKCIDNFLFSK